MLLKVLQRELVHKLRQFTPQGIENVLWAFATLGHHPGMPALPCPLYSTTPTGASNTKLPSRSFHLLSGSLVRYCIYHCIPLPLLA